MTALLLNMTMVRFPSPIVAHAMEKTGAMVAKNVATRDANSGPLFLIRGFGISPGPNPGSRDNPGIKNFFIRNYQYKNNINLSFLFACLAYANNWISNLWRILYVRVLREEKS